MARGTSHSEMHANPGMRSECLTPCPIDAVGERLELILQVQLQLARLSAGPPADHPNGKGVIAATPATRLAPG
jgi:hypothetical protein